MAVSRWNLPSVEGVPENYAENEALLSLSWLVGQEKKDPTLLTLVS